MSRKLNALALAQADEARLAHQVATTTELNALEVQAQDAKSRAAVPPSEKNETSALAPDAPAPVSEVSGEAAEQKVADTATKA